VVGRNSVRPFWRGAAPRRARRRRRNRLPHRESKRRHPRHGKIVETAKQLIVEWSNELRAVVDRLTKLGPDIRPTLICNLRGKPFTESGFRSNWHRLMQKAVAKGAIT